MLLNSLDGEFMEVGPDAPEAAMEIPAVVINVQSCIGLCTLGCRRNDVGVAQKTAEEIINVIDFQLDERNPDYANDSLQEMFRYPEMRQELEAQSATIKYLGGQYTLDANLQSMFRQWCRRSIQLRNHMKYDHPDYHWSNEFPEDLSEDNAMTHMGFFFAWALSRDLISDFHSEEDDSAEPLKRVASRKMSPREYVIQFCDSQFTNEDFTDIGNAFVEHYYIKSYFDDYRKTFEGDFETIYHVEDTWANADKMVPVLDKRFEGWKQLRDRKPWWKFW